MEILHSVSCYWHETRISFNLVINQKVTLTQGSPTSFHFKISSSCLKSWKRQRLCIAIYGCKYLENLRDFTIRFPLPLLVLMFIFHYMGSFHIYLIRCGNAECKLYQYSFPFCFQNWPSSFEIWETDGLMSYQPGVCKVLPYSAPNQNGEKKSPVSHCA